MPFRAKTVPVEVWRAALHPRGMGKPLITVTAGQLIQEVWGRVS
jgi:hypothetical protein